MCGRRAGPAAPAPADRGPLARRAGESRAPGRPGRGPARPGPDRSAGRGLPKASRYQYDVARHRRAGCQVALGARVLPRCPGPAGRHRGAAGRGRCAGPPAYPRHAVQLPGAVSYEEHLGRFGANFRIDLGDRIHVTRRPAAGALAARGLHQHRRGAAAVRDGRPRAACCCTRPASSSTAAASCCPRGPTPARPAPSCGCCASTGGRFLSDDMTILDAGRHARTASPSRSRSAATRCGRSTPDDLTRAEWRAAAAAEPAALQGRPRRRHWRWRRCNLPIMTAQRDDPDRGPAAEVQRRPARAPASMIRRDQVERPVHHRARRARARRRPRRGRRSTS